MLEIEKWVDNRKNVEDESIKFPIATANNHYAGFGLGTVNVFRNVSVRTIPVTMQVLYNLVCTVS